MVGMDGQGPVPAILSGSQFHRYYWNSPPYNPFRPHLLLRNLPYGRFSGHHNMATQAGRPYSSQNKLAQNKELCRGEKSRKGCRTIVHNKEGSQAFQIQQRA